MNKKIAVAIPIMVVLLIIAGVAVILMIDKGPKEYNDWGQFKADAFIEFDLPTDATDVRMAIDEGLLSRTMFYSFVLEDDALNDYIKKTVETKYACSNDDGTKEIITDEYYDMLVKDIDGVYPDNEMDDFPHSLKFDSVIDDSAEDYRVLFYYPTGSGPRCYGVFYNDKTNKVFGFYHATVK